MLTIGAGIGILMLVISLEFGTPSIADLKSSRNLS
jgi:hypothetical protein